VGVKVAVRVGVGVEVWSSPATRLTNWQPSKARGSNKIPAKKENGTLFPELLFDLFIRYSVHGRCTAYHNIPRKDGEDSYFMACKV